MGEYIRLINRTKKEYLCSACVDSGLKKWGLILGPISKLLTYLVVSYSDIDPRNNRYGGDKERFSPLKHRFDGDMLPMDSNSDNEFFFSGYWATDELGSVSDHGCITDYGDYNYVMGIEKDQKVPSEYQNITIPVTLEYNSEFLDDESENRITLKPCYHHKDITSWIFYERFYKKKCEPHIRWDGEHGDEDARKMIERKDKEFDRALRESIENALSGKH